MASSQVYEFPYSGHQTSSMPFLNNDIDQILSNISSPLNNLSYQHPSTITLQCVPQINPTIGGNLNTYQVPEHVPLESILREFGVDVNSLRQSSSAYNYHTSVFQPIELNILPSSHRRRRLVCHEVSDQDDDDYYYRRPSHHRHSSNRSPQSPGAIHETLSQVWNKARNAPNRPPISPDHRNAIGNVWHRTQNASHQNAPISNVFDRMRQASGPMNQPPPPPQNTGAMSRMFGGGNPPTGMNQPNSAIANVWRRADDAVTRSPPPSNNPWNSMQQTGPFPPNRPNSYPPSSSPAVGNVWSHLQQGSYPRNPNSPNPYPSSSSPAVGNVWSHLQQSSYPRNTNPPNSYPPSPSPPMNNPWNPMGQGPSFRMPPSNPGRVPAPTSFASVLSQAHQQRSQFAGAG